MLPLTPPLTPTETVKLRIAALTSGRSTPSSRFRVRQHIPTLARHGINVEEHCPRIGKYSRLPGPLRAVKPRYLGPLGIALVAARTFSRVPGVVSSRAADATWLERELVPHFYSFEGMLRQPLFFDIDDAIWLKIPFAPKVASTAYSVLAGNTFLADWASTFCKRIRIIPTAVDTNYFRPNPGVRGGSRFVIGWTGTSGNLRYLYDVEEALAAFLSKTPEALLKIICDTPPRFHRIPQSSCLYVPWSSEIEASALATLDIGIMPLRDTEWERGKCSFKFLQYMAVGIPSIVSPVGMNNEILAQGYVGLAAKTRDDWVDALDQLIHNPQARADLGTTARSLATDRYSLPIVARQIAEGFLYG